MASTRAFFCSASSTFPNATPTNICIATHHCRNFSLLPIATNKSFQQSTHACHGRTSGWQICCWCPCCWQGSSPCPDPPRSWEVFKLVENRSRYKV
ncbi:hypothetical protein SUGI_0726790 [Cryptomeria japonica]|nr:hypothetical protein SUGI_0726790 [Cryptomeria japonica]